MKNKIIIAPSILSADFSKLGEEIKAIDSAGADYIHMDVMDGNFVPNLTFGFPVIKSMRKYTDLPFDVHLMIEKPERYIEEYANAGADIITIHSESTIHLHRTIHQVKNCGKKVGVSLNPSTPVDVLKYIIEDLDMILLMSVNPGFGGQKFIESTIEKIKDVKKLRNNIDIEIDGGITDITIKKCIDAGANIFVAGSYIFSGNYSERIKKLREINL
jgi:ribulose-phosphate 3-epimerase